MSPSAPAMIGPYRVSRTLGEGGIGVVYEAAHAVTGERVAVKTVRLPEASMLASIRREVYALQRLRHPGVVRVIDQGVDAELGPWYAMELLVGASLRRRFEAWREARGDGPSRAAELADVATVFHAMCEALEVVHASGVVHRDLKPENVMLTDDGRVVLVDFGLASQFGVLDRVGYARSNGGTLRYLAPELLEGDEADARADLYALGCMLYESLSGATPFEGSSRRALLEQHRAGALRPLSSRVEGAPRGLDELLALTLARRAEDRVGHASDVARALVALGARAAPPAVSPYLYRASLVGREAVIERVADATWRSARGHGFAMLLGEGGVGKTRVLVDVAARLQRDRVRVIEGGAEHRAAGRDGGRGATPLSTFKPFLAWAADQCREDPARFEDDLVAPFGDVLARYEPSFAALRTEGPRAPVETTQRAVVESLRRALAVCAADAPLALVLDDLQWADELSLALVAALTGDDARPEGLTVIAASRPEELPDSLRVALRETRALQIDLGRLDVGEVSSLVRGLLAMREVPPELADFVFARSEGNPFFAAEYVRAAIVEGHLRRDDAGRWFLAREAQGAALRESVSAPSSVAEVVRWRLADLGPDASLTLDAAAVLGREPHGEVLSAVVGLAETSLFEALDELRRRQVLEPARDGRLRFAHDLLRETAARALSRDHARRLHRRAAEASERHPSTRDDVESIGFHWARAGVDDRAARCLARAADLAREAFANQRAATLYGAAHDHASQLVTGPDEATWRALCASLDERRGVVLERLGAHDDARRAFGRSLAAIDDHDRVDRARLKRLMAKTWEALHRHAEARAAYDEASAELDAVAEGSRGDAWWRERVEVQVERVWLHYWLGDVEAMTSLLARARPLVLERGAALQRARFYQAAVHNDLRRLRYRLGDATVEAARASRDAACEAHDLAAVAYARFILAFAELFAGRCDEAEREMRGALADAQRAGDVVLTLRCRTYLTVALRGLARVDEAAVEARACLDAARRLRMTDYEGVARANLAWVAWRGGDPDEALREGHAALAIWAELASRFVYPLEWLARLPCLACDLDAGRLDACFAHAEGLLGSVQHDLPGEALTQCKSALDARDHGDPSAARAALASILQSALREGLS